MRRRIPLHGHFDIRATLRLRALWGGTSWQKVEHDGGWFARRFRSGTATVHMVHAGDHVDAEAWGDGAEELLDSVPALLGLDDDPRAGWEAHHGALVELRKQLRGFRLGRTGEVYPRLVAAALAQKVSGKNGKTVLWRLARTWGELAPGPRDDLFLLPRPRDLASRPYYDFHPLGIEQHRALLLRRIASRASALQRAATMPFAEARAHLEKLPGIGPWTSGVVVGLALGDPDAVPIGDYNLPNIVAFNLAGEPRADDARMLELLAPYAGQRGRVVRMLKSGGSKAPRYGPRQAVRDIRKM